MMIIEQTEIRFLKEVSSYVFDSSSRSLYATIESLDDISVIHLREPSAIVGHAVLHFLHFIC